MQDYEEFQKIGKKVPFEVPTGFFESFAEKTLKEAITREHIHKKNNIRRLIFSVAASVALLFYLGSYFKQDSADPNLIVERIKPTNQSASQIIRETLKHKKIVELNKVMPKNINERELTTLEKSEVLKDILSDLSDDDLEQIATRYKTDAFIYESFHNHEIHPQ